MYVQKERNLFYSQKELSYKVFLSLNLQKTTVSFQLIILNIHNNLQNQLELSICER